MATPSFIVSDEKSFDLYFDEDPPFSESCCYARSQPPPHELLKLNSMISWARAQRHTHICFHGLLNDAQLEALIGFAQLQFLTVENANFPLEFLPKFPSLVGLIVGSITLPRDEASFPVCYDKLRTMRSMRIIDPLDLTTTETLLQQSIHCLQAFGIHAPVTEEIINKVLVKLPRLTSLTLMSPSPVDVMWLLPFQDPIWRICVRAQLAVDPATSKVPNKCVEKVTFTDCQLVADFTFLSVFRKLKILTMRNAPHLTDVNQLASLFTKKDLTKLDLSGTAVLDDEFLTKLREAEIRLKHLIAYRSGAVDANTGFTDVGLSQYLQWPLNCQLVTLDIAGHTQITRAPFLAIPGQPIIACLPHLTTLGVRYTGISTSVMVQSLLTLRDLVLKTASGSSSQQRLTDLKLLNVHLSGRRDRNNVHVTSATYLERNCIHVWFYEGDCQTPYPGPDALINIRN
jgi:hypothetical protein